MVMQDWWWCYRIESGMECCGVYGMLEMVIIVMCIHLMPVGFQPMLLYFFLNHFQEPLAHAVSIPTGTTSCTAKSSLFLIEFIACFCCCGRYALSHISQAFLRYDYPQRCNLLLTF